MIRFVLACIAMLSVMPPRDCGAKEWPTGHTAYVDYRQTLLREGWKPVIIHHDRGTGPDGWDAIRDAQDVLDAGFAEVDFCSPIENNYCHFNFRRGLACRVVSTAGGFSPDPRIPKVYMVENMSCYRWHHRRP